MSIADTGKPRGRPPTGIGKAIGLRLYPALDAALGAFIDDQPDPKPSRPEVLREALAEHLKAKGYLE